MDAEIAQVTRGILEEITPTQAERERILALARELERRVSAACVEIGVAAVVRLEGSVAKDTWLGQDPDVDVFMRLPTSVPRDKLGELSLKIAKKATEGSRQVERFAEHPYLEAFLDGTRVNVVPCYDAKPGEWLSATDRTPFHTDYVNAHLKPSQRSQVRLLKKFMKGIGVYGAEIKVGGFSGYLCELLVLHFGGFVEVLQAFARHVQRRTVDMAGYYVQRERELELLFPEPLVIVDPVDKGRNVASAVQPQRLFEFVAASRGFLENPNKKFFDPPGVAALSPDALKGEFRSRGSTLVFLRLSAVHAVPDVLWGQLHRTGKALRKQLELSDFRVLRGVVWSREDSSMSVFILELEQLSLPNVKKHLGPPLERAEECGSFLAKYKANSAVAAGPYVEDGRWVVLIHRKFTDAAEMLKAKLANGGRDVGVANLVAEAVKRDLELFVGGEVSQLYEGNRDFAEFLTVFLSGKPRWLSE